VRLCEDFRARYAVLREQVPSDFGFVCLGHGDVKEEMEPINDLVAKGVAFQITPFSCLAWECG